MNYDFEINKLASVLKREIPNLLDYYTNEEVMGILERIGLSTSDSIANLFMDEDEVWDRPMRRCSHCGNLMTEGYLLDNEYACSDECRNALYDPNDPENGRRLYLIDCYEIEPEEVEGMTADEIEEMYEDCEVSDSVMYTEWN